MTRVLAVDSKNDIYISATGSLASATGLTATMQAAQQAVQAQLGEMMYAVDQGVPSFQTVWNGAPNVAQFEAYLRRTILAVANVTGIDSLTISTAGNKLSYVANIQTIYGPGALNG